MRRLRILFSPDLWRATCRRRSAHLMLGPVIGVFALVGCATTPSALSLQKQAPDTLLTSYLVATGMVEHRLVARIAAHRASPRDVSVALAIDHNAWTMVRQAILQPTDQNIRLADESLSLLLQQAPEPERPAAP